MNKEDKELADKIWPKTDEPINKPFPYWPPKVSIEEMKRMEVMMELNKWANNDPFMAKRSAETLILLLADQFDINFIQFEK